METTPSYDDFFALIHKTELALNDFAQANSTELRDYSPTKVYAKTPPSIQTKYTAIKSNTLVISKKCVIFFYSFFLPGACPRKNAFPCIAYHHHCPHKATQPWEHGARIIYTW